VLYQPQHSTSYPVSRGDSARSVMEAARPRRWILRDVPANVGASISNGDNLFYINRRTAELIWHGAGQHRLLMPGVFPRAAILTSGPSVLIIDREWARAYSFEVEEGLASCPRRARLPAALRELALLSFENPVQASRAVLVQVEVAVSGQLHQVAISTQVLADPGVRLPGRWRVTARRFISIAGMHRSVVTDEPFGVHAPGHHDDASGIGDARSGEDAG
jgi:hypothetical protein